MTVRLGSFGIWSRETLWRSADAAEAAIELEEIGLGTLWLGGASGDLVTAEALLDATTSLTVATGIVSIWESAPDDLAAAYARVTARHPEERLLVGIGNSHGLLVNSRGGNYDRPVARTIAFLDALDTHVPSIPRERRALAALGPRMLGIAADRTLGTHPYLTTPEHTAQARELLGKDTLIAPEQGVVLEADPAKARALARGALRLYLALENYTNNFRRLGFTDEDLADGGSDRLIDALFAWGTDEAVAARVREHLDAGADHVCAQIITATPDTLPRPEWRRLAAALR
ncbi:putative F420-dependent oxidoreductase [Catenuloplanes nepalensis]|uniref:F420-dependent oxidoreductase n=1 Tax=Catenuloplanes nepalensis TaxID=587533 RepID=A0ABT9MWW4_9ACTN|nr:LLM class F420-dependent oxidoreductase [Catenuloplanes nepalensis]MDP9795927.1 putative F420-dependent oxidoreductase [Catenuloplanes nepalensis]